MNREGASSVSSPPLGSASELPYHGMTQSSRTSSASHQMTPLANDFVPTADDVICGRGKKCYNHIGNERFRRRVTAMLDEYSSAKSKLDKSGVLSRVMAEVRRSSPGGGFVKQDESGQWFEVGDFLAREKTSQAFRDALHERYKSSNISKKKRRKQEQAKVSDTHRIARSEQEVSLRLERISNELLGSVTLSPMDPHHLGGLNRANIGILSRYTSLRHPGQPSPLSRPIPNHFPDPLFGGNSGLRTINAPANTPLSSSYSTRSSPYHEVELPPRAKSMPIPHTSSMSANDVLHSSMPNIHFQDAGHPFHGREPLESDMNRSLPNLDYFDRRREVEANASLLSSCFQTTNRELEGGMSMDPRERLRPRPDRRFSGGSRKEQQQDGGGGGSSKRPSGLLKVTEDNSSSSDKDLLACLEKLTEHSISEGNPFEPIPLASLDPPPSLSSTNPYHFRPVDDQSNEFAEE